MVEHFCVEGSVNKFQIYPSTTCLLYTVRCTHLCHIWQVGAVFLYISFLHITFMYYMVLVIPLYCDNIWQNKLKPPTPSMTCLLYTVICTQRRRKNIYICVGFLCWTCNQTPLQMWSLWRHSSTPYILQLVISENDNVTTTHHDRGSWPSYHRESVLIENSYNQWRWSY